MLVLLKPHINIILCGNFCKNNLKQNNTKCDILQAGLRIIFLIKMSNFCTGYDMINLWKRNIQVYI